jgi:hypothetical protein
LKEQADQSVDIVFFDPMFQRPVKGSEISERFEGSQILNRFWKLQFKKRLEFQEKEL